MSTESLQTNRQVDLDQLTNDFTKWQGKYRDLGLQNISLQQELNHLIDEREQGRKAARTTEEELTQYRSIITSLQDTLAKRCDLEDENRSLREVVANMEETITKLKEEGQGALLDVQAHLEQVHATDKAEMEDSHHQQVREMEEKARALQQAVHDKSAEIKQLQQQLVEAQKDRQMEIVKLRQEYDAKLVKLQSARTQRSDKPNSASSHILREKMLNAQAASEREVASLRQTVSELKRKLSNQQQPSGAKRKR
ncbi:nucleoprotein TPR-like [Acanthaster planci]|uniref:Nucleoprotein TPR-like n=1 Tax=Acanthaster planci TaxID=133434 RepID=A0A8B7Y3S8_ACAPL|nr:nucleoprotein TPR-like [Acanthaster planci]